MADSSYLNQVELSLNHSLEHKVDKRNGKQKDRVKVTIMLKILLSRENLKTRRERSMSDFN
jgi:hypothetical protein